MHKNEVEKSKEVFMIDIQEKYGSLLFNDKVMKGFLVQHTKL